MMKRANPLSSRIRWTIVFVAVVLHPVLLYHLLPVLGEPTNFLSAVAPITATLLFNWRAGIAAMFLNVVSSACVFNMLTAMDAPEGIPKAVTSSALLSAVCFGAEKLRRYIEQRKAI
jgi:hypothetical protein